MDIYIYIIQYSVYESNLYNTKYIEYYSYIYYIIYNLQQSFVLYKLDSYTIYIYIPFIYAFSFEFSQII